MAWVVCRLARASSHLPNSTSVLQLERLEVADYGTLLIPANITQVTVDELHLGRDARIAIVPSASALQLQVRHAQLQRFNFLGLFGGVVKIPLLQKFQAFFVRSR